MEPTTCHLNSKNKIMSKFEKNKYNLNKTSIFILPITGKKAPDISSDYYNSYLNKELIEMYIVIDSEDDPVINTDNFYIPIKKEDKIGKWTILTVDVPSERYRDVQLFMKGKYSKMSLEYKHHLIYIYSPWKKSFNRLYTILFPQPIDRERLSKFFDVQLDPDSEVHDIPIPEEEIFNIVDLLENNNTKNNNSHGRTNEVKVTDTVN